MTTHYGAHDFFGVGLEKAAFPYVLSAAAHGVLTMGASGKKPTSSEEARKSFEARLETARRAGEAKPRTVLDETSAFGIATRLVAELVSGLVVGGGIGWLLDRWLGTSPWLLVVFFILGVVAGITNVFRAARKMNKPRETPPAADDGTDDPAARS